MPAVKPPAAGRGRPAGSLNKATTEFRQTVTMLLEKNAANVEIWLERVANGAPGNEEDGIKAIPPAPDKALDLLAKLAEFAAPKLARTEHVGEGGGPVQVEIVRFGKDTPAQ